MGVIFDLDGTLINSIPLHTTALYKAMNKVLGNHGVPLDFIKREIRFPSPILFDDLRGFGIDISRSEIIEILDERRRYLSEENVRKVKIFSSAFDVVRLLDRKGVRYCIATAMYTKDLEVFEKVLKLRRLSKVIINPPAFGYEKPNPFILNRSMEVMRMRPESSCYVGDSPYDLITANRAGMHFMGVYNKALARLGVFFENLERLKDYLKVSAEFFKD